MFHIFNLVLLSMTMVAGKSVAQAEDLCEQDVQWKNEVCIHINNTAVSNEHLLLRLKRKEDLFGRNGTFQETQNVSSIASFFLALVKYNNTLSGLDASMKVYMRTPLYSTEQTIARNKEFAEEYLTMIEETISQLAQTTDKMSEVVKQTGPVEQQIEVITMNSTIDIYRETFHVTRNLATILTTWAGQCHKC